MSGDVLPPVASPAAEARPWPVVLLTALGAWLAAVPLLAVVGMLLGELLIRGAGPYLVGPLVLAGAVVVLRSASVPLFFEQLAVPALLVGGGSLAFGLFRDLPLALAAATLAGVALAVALAVRQAWLRALLGATAAGLLVLACVPPHWNLSGPEAQLRFGLAWQFGLALWLLALRGPAAAPSRAGGGLEPIGAGWLLAVLAGLAAWSGMSFLVGASLGPMAELGASTRGGAGGAWGAPLLSMLSAGLAVCAALRLATAWPTLRTAWCGGVAAVGVGLAWFMPALGASLLALAWCASSGRPRLAATAALAAVWIVGGFYYALALPLADKALLLCGAAAVLAALAVAGWPRGASSTPAAVAPEPSASSSPLSARAGIALTALASLLVVNAALWQKESLIAHGRPVFLALAPVDPRSLMEGDYMRLNFQLPGAWMAEPEGLLAAERPRVLARVDAAGVATLIGRASGAPLAADEIVIELTPLAGRWAVATDAWYFAEGEGARWAQARYGEFRVNADGQALLVGLRGRDLAPL